MKLHANDLAMAADCSGFQCDNGICIHQSLECDWGFDCDDGSDELNCSEYYYSYKTCTRQFVEQRCYQFSKQAFAA